MGEKMKKILLSAALFVAFAGVATGSSINGDYEGNPIVKIKSNGSVIDPGEVPAMIYNGKTMVPISSLRNLGAYVTWDQDTYSVEVTFPKTFNISEATKKLKPDVEFIQQYSDGVSLNTISFRYASTLDELMKPSNNNVFVGIMLNSLPSDANLIEIIDKDGNIFTCPMQGMRDFMASKITADELLKQYKFDIKNQPSQSSNNQSNNPATSSQQTVNNSQTTTTQNDTHLQACQKIESDYTIQYNDYQRTHNAFSGGTREYLNQLTQSYQQRKQNAGC